MTKEEAIKNIKEHCYFANLNPKAKKALDFAVKTLEQQPCEDAISRQAVIDALNKTSGIRGDALKALYDLPPVTPQPKMGRWITWKEAGNEIASETRFECSVCHDAAQTLCNGLDLLSSYCPNCGAKMESEEV